MSWLSKISKFFKSAATERPEADQKGTIAKAQQPQPQKNYDQDNTKRLNISEHIKIREGVSYREPENNIMIESVRPETTKAYSQMPKSVYD